jgi:thiol-disulfide isomerase/thioredoxin
MTEEKSQKKRRTWKREIAEWAAMIAIGLFIYAMGWHTEIIGRLQQAVLWTGIIQADTEIKEGRGPIVDYNMPLVSLDGESANLSEFKGKVIFLNYWATWCPPCIAEMPNIQKLYEQYKDEPGVKFVMVSLDEDPQKAKEFLENREFTFGAYQLAGRRPEVFQSSIIPTTYIISRNGTLASKKQGMANYNTDAFKNFLNQLLDE